jgi:carboxylate-amine ligase
MLIAENIWRSQRYGVEGSLMDFGESALIPFHDLADELVYMLQPDAEILGCVDELEHIRTIARQGTSARRQLDVYDAAIEAGESEEAAMRAVVEHLIADTKAGL